MDSEQTLADAATVTYSKTKSAKEFCTCFEYDSIEEEVAEMDILFLGRATGPATSIGMGEDGLEMFATPFRIDEVLKGKMPKRVKLVHPQESSACGTIRGFERCRDWPLIKRNRV